MNIKRENQNVGQRSHRPSVLIARDTIGQRSFMNSSHEVALSLSFPAVLQSWCSDFLRSFLFKSVGLLRFFYKQHEPEKRWKKRKVVGPT